MDSGDAGFGRRGQEKDPGSLGKLALLGLDSYRWNGVMYPCWAADVYRNSKQLRDGGYGLFPHHPLPQVDKPRSLLRTQDQHSRITSSLWSCRSAPRGNIENWKKQPKKSLVKSTSCSLVSFYVLLQANTFAKKSVPISVDKPVEWCRKQRWRWGGWWRMESQDLMRNLYVSLTVTRIDKSLGKEKMCCR